MGNEALIVRTLGNGFDDASTDHALDAQIGTDTYYRGTFLSTAEATRIFGAGGSRSETLLPQANEYVAGPDSMRAYLTACQFCLVGSTECYILG